MRLYCQTISLQKFSGHNACAIRRLNVSELNPEFSLLFTDEIFLGEICEIIFLFSIFYPNDNASLNCRDLMVKIA